MQPSVQELSAMAQAADPLQAVLGWAGVEPGLWAVAQQSLGQLNLVREVAAIPELFYQRGLAGEVRVLRAAAEPGAEPDMTASKKNKNQG